MHGGSDGSCMVMRRGVDASAAPKSTQGIVANDFQQPIARWIPRVDADQRTLDPAAQAIDNGPFVDEGVAAHGDGQIDREATDEYAEFPEQGLVLGRQQVVA